MALYFVLIVQIFLLSLSSFVHSNENQQNSNKSIECPEVPKDVPKGSEGEICYRRTDGAPSYFFVGTKIAGEPDSKIYKATKFTQGIEPTERDEGKAFAVKVVSNSVGASRINLAKPVVMIKHEMKMLLMMNRLEADKPVEEKSVVKLFGGGEVVDKSLMNVEFHDVNLGNFKKTFSMIYIMEFGDNTLDKYLVSWDKQMKCEGWTEEAKKKARASVVEEPIKLEAKELLLKLAETLLTFHRHAVHLHLKPGNWIFVERENKWKLIDLQSTVPNSALTDQLAEQVQQERGAEKEPYPERSPDDFLEFACNSLRNEIFLTELIAPVNEMPSTYASPEHEDVCIKIVPPTLQTKAAMADHQKKKKEQLKRIGPKCDVWAFGVLMLEILAHTPQINPIIHHSILRIDHREEDPIELLIVLRKEFGISLMGPIRFIKEVAHFSGPRKKVENDGVKTKKLMGKYMERIEKHFPTEFSVLMKIFEKDPEKRIEQGEIVRLLKEANEGSKKGEAKEGSKKGEAKEGSKKGTKSRN